MKKPSANDAPHVATASEEVNDGEPCENDDEGVAEEAANDEVNDDEPEGMGNEEDDESEEAAGEAEDDFEEWEDDDDSGIKFQPEHLAMRNGHTTSKVVFLTSHWHDDRMQVLSVTNTHVAEFNATPSDVAQAVIADKVLLDSFVEVGIKPPYKAMAAADINFVRKQMRARCAEVIMSFPPRS